MGRKRAHLSRKGKARLSRRARNFHDLTAGEAVNRLVSTKEPACSRLFGPHAVTSSLKTYPGALSTGAAAIEKSDPPRVAFFMSPTPAATSSLLSSPLMVPAWGRCLVRRAPARMPGPSMPIEATNEYKQPAFPHKGQPGGAAAIRVIAAGFPARGRDDGLPCHCSGLAITWAGSASPTGKSSRTRVIANVTPRDLCHAPAHAPVAPAGPGYWRCGRERRAVPARRRGQLR